MNFLVLALLFFLVLRMAAGYKNGMVLELQHFFTFLVSAVSIALFCKAVSSYMQEDMVTFLSALVLLLVLGIGYKIIKLVFFSAKLISKLPVIHLLDKILGILMGAFEILLFVWAFFLFIDTFRLGIVGKILYAYIHESSLLVFLEQNNLLGNCIESVSHVIFEAFQSKI